MEKPMPLSLVRFNLIDPSLDAAALSDRYRAMLEMADFIDANGFFMATFEEHHGAVNAWSPTPLLNAATVLARTTNLAASVSALLLPLHDPIRVAEDIAVIDLMSGGRLTVILGLGYRPSEYELLGKDWSRRGKIMDESISVLLKAWSGEPFEHNGGTHQITPSPVTKPHPFIMIGGTSKIAARRAARFGLPLSPAAHLPELEAYYYDQCEQHGTQGFCAMPDESTQMTFVAEDPDKAWAELGHHFLHEASMYSSWQTSDISSAVHSHAETPEELRAEGIYQIITPDDAAALEQVVHHPLCGGMPIDAAWESLQLYVDALSGS
jgi:alkanesulfonate monooxygenase SsuD/methylene tetrahydromethanopterin reductase-like flavin-dependent oxidoreductase (luciferase family)